VAYSTIVLDASFAVRAVLPVSVSAAELEHITAWRRVGVDICGPDLLLAEAVSVIRQAVYRGAIREVEGQTAVEDLFRLGLRVIPSDRELCLSALAWAGRLGQSKAYDGFYLAVAERTHGELWTGDRRLANGAAQLGLIWVRWIGEPQAGA
jgi:predicted nucleic acid-binding protein